MEETVGFGAVDYFAAQRVVLNGVPDEKGGIAEENNLRHRAAYVKAGERLRAALAGADPFSVVPRRAWQRRWRPLKALKLLLRQENKPGVPGAIREDSSFAADEEAAIICHRMTKKKVLRRFRTTVIPVQLHRGQRAPCGELVPSDDPAGISLGVDF
jgi:hypothetical protein